MKANTATSSSRVTSGGIGKGVDIIGEGAEWDTPLAPYFDMSEIAWAPDGTRLAYTCKPLTGAKYAVSTDSDIFVYDTETGATTNICKGLTPSPVTMRQPKPNCLSSATTNTPYSRPTAPKSHSVRSVVRAMKPTRSV